LTKQIRTFSNDETLVAERRKHLVLQSIEVFVKQGYDETTMADIARACGWSKGLVYHYVSNKEDVLYLIANDQAEGTIRGFLALRERCLMLPPAEAVLEYIDYYYRIVDSTQNYQVFLNQVAALLPREDRKILFDADRFALDVLDEILKRGVKEGDFQIDDTLLMAHNILLIGRTWADRRWFLQKNFKLEHYLSVQKKAVLRMLGAASVPSGGGRGGEMKAKA
jgi:AcrR family transcriptional regulator